jgi:hypothetical protein
MSKNAIKLKLNERHITVQILQNVNFLVTCHSNVSVYFSLRFRRCTYPWPLKKKELQQKIEAATAKNNQILKDQQESEEKKVQSKKSS